uniref:Dehydrogenase/reductase SDR family member 7-like n=1 Tax=Hirondellea gigas TaxID=1518452 RepID=A0A2P2I018_9CRUS
MLLLLGATAAAASAVCYLISIKAALMFILTALIIKQVTVADADLVLYLLDKSPLKFERRMQGKVVWITGSSRGIGAALAIRLAKAGAKLALSARDEEQLQQVKQLCIEAGSAPEDVLVVPLDMTQHSQHEAALKTITQHFTQVSVLVSNAGRTQRGHWDAIDVAVDRELFELNVFSLIVLARLVNKHFTKNGGGHHVVMSSTAGKFGAPMSASYTGSKHALHGYFECLRIECAVDNIDVTMLCPGPVETTLLQYCFTEQLDQAPAVVRSGRRMSAERCAQLCSVAMSCKLPEVWVCEQPILAIQYTLHYFPSLPHLLIKSLGVGFIMKLRDGRSAGVPPPAAKH